MCMFLYLECLVCTFHHKADLDIQSLCSCSSLLVKHLVYGKLRVVCILHPLALVLLVELHIHTFLNELLIKLLHHVELACKVNHRACLAALVYHEQRRDSGSFCNKCVISTECRRNVNNTCTVLCSYIITRDDTERLV